MIYDEKAKCLRREDGELTVHVDELEDGIVYFQDRLNNMFGVSMLEIEEIIALGGRDYAAGRRAGIEEAAKVLETGIFGGLTTGTVQLFCRVIRALLEAKT